MKPIDLTEHPEGGRFREVYRSPMTVTHPGGQLRAALTHIYFSLNPGEVSRFHKVTSDEVWNLYQGEGLRLHLWDGTQQPPVSVVLSADANRFCHVIPAGIWQAAEPLSGPVLVGCSVAPGFDFSDFTLLDDHPETAERLRTIATELDPKRWFTT